jgi:Lysine efflux permease
MRSHVGKIVALCALSDFILIGAGVGGASVLVERYPVFVHAMLYVGLAYLAWFGINALRRAVRPEHAVMDGENVSAAPVQRAVPIILMTLAFTWLNPHVYLDTFLLIGTAGAREPEGARVAFALGAMAVSGIWFIGLGYGARPRAALQAGHGVARAGWRDRQHGAAARGDAVAVSAASAVVSGRGWQQQAAIFRKHGRPHHGARVRSAVPRCSRARTPSTWPPHG